MVIPSYLQAGATAAVTAATTIIDLLLTDSDLREGLLGIPHYLHTMTAFACVFLLKIASKSDGHFVDTGSETDLTLRFVTQLRSIGVGKWHLVHLMADGLEKLVRSLSQNTPGSLDINFPDPAMFASHNQVMSEFDQTSGELFDSMSTNTFMDLSNMMGNPFLQFPEGNLADHYSNFGFQ